MTGGTTTSQRTRGCVGLQLRPLPPKTGRRGDARGDPLRARRIGEVAAAKASPLAHEAMPPPQMVNPSEGRRRLRVLLPCFSGASPPRFGFPHPHPGLGRGASGANHKLADVGVWPNLAKFGQSWAAFGLRHRSSGQFSTVLEDISVLVFRGQGVGDTSCDHVQHVIAASGSTC